MTAYEIAEMRVMNKQLIAERNDLLVKLTKLEQWKYAVEHEVIVTCGGPHDWTDPREMVKYAINWNVMVALDPAVSEAAQALINKGKAEIEQETFELCEDCGWRAFLPGEGCLFCNRDWDANYPTEKEPV